MNYNKNVVVFTVVFTFILLAYSLFAAFFPSYSLGLDNVNIVADVFKTRQVTDSALAANGPARKDSAGVVIPAGQRDINVYLTAHTITGFTTDSTYVALPQLMHKLEELRKTKKGKIRIAWLGDSFIEGDQLTKTVRQRLQQLTGAYGVGFVPVTSVTVDGFRTSISQKWTGEWVEENFKNKELSNPLFLSGRVYHTGSGTLTVKDLTLGKDSTQRLVKSLVCGPVPGNFTITVNGQPRQLTARNRINRLVLDSSTSHVLTIEVNNASVPVYGISMEPADGVVVDNFSFRGISGEELGKLDSSFLRNIQQQNPYDLVVLEYGVNVLYRPDNKDFSWHKRNMAKIMPRLKASMPGAEFLVISTSDRGFRYGDVARSAVGINNLVRTQAELAYENDMAFYNMFASMGGEGTIVRWADGTPSLAGHDYVHPNGRGAEILGDIFYRSFIKDYNKLNNKHAAGQPAPPPAAQKVATVAPQPTVAATPTVTPVATAGYKVSSNGVITDEQTGLEWLVGEDRDYTWDEARHWADSLNRLKGGWMLPTIQQMQALYDSTSVAGAGYTHADGKVYTAHLNKAFGKIGHSAWVWTSFDVDSVKAVTINFNQGKRVKTNKKNNSYPVRVFAVRKTEQSH